MATFTCFVCDLCGVKLNKEKEINRSGLTTGKVSFWLHNERDGYVNQEGTHYEICPTCTKSIMDAVEAIKNT